MIKTRPQLETRGFLELHDNITITLLALEGECPVESSLKGVPPAKC